MSRALCLAVATVLALGVAPPLAAGAPWTWPVRGRVISRFSVGPDRFAPGQRRGIVIAAPAGTPVRAACAGTVGFAGPVADNGLTVSVWCKALAATYVHLGSLAVRAGAVVAREQRIGSVGLSGRPRGSLPQVGLGARRREGDREYVDPLRLLGDPDAARPGAPVAPPPARVADPPVRPPLVAPTRSLPGEVAAPAPVAAPGGALPLGRLWLPAGAGLLAAGLGVGGIGAALAASRRRRRAPAAGPAATRGGAQARR